MVHRLQVHFMIGKWSPFKESDCGCWHLFSFNAALSMDGPQEYERMNVQVLPLSYFVRDTKKPCLPVTLSNVSGPSPSRQALSLTLSTLRTVAIIENAFIATLVRSFNLIPSGRTNGKSHLKNSPG